MVKNRYFAVYDYGMGGIWVYITARSHEEITTNYPDLKVLIDRPPWMTPGEEPDEGMTFDIDDPLSGWLAMPGSLTSTTAG
jgi:hypothetical protein